MQPSLVDHLVMKLFATSLPKLTHLDSQCWNAFNRRSWEGEAHQAWSGDRNIRFPAVCRNFQKTLIWNKIESRCKISTTRSRRVVSRRNQGSHPSAKLLPIYQAPKPRTISSSRLTQSITGFKREVGLRNTLNQTVGWKNNLEKQAVYKKVKFSHILHTGKPPNLVIQHSAIKWRERLEAVRTCNKTMQPNLRPRGALWTSRTWISQMKARIFVNAS